MLFSQLFQSDILALWYWWKFTCRRSIRRLVSIHIQCNKASRKAAQFMEMSLINHEKDYIVQWESLVGKLWQIWEIVHDSPNWVYSIYTYIDIHIRCISQCGYLAICCYSIPFKFGIHMNFFISGSHILWKIFHQIQYYEYSVVFTCLIIPHMHVS